MHRVCHDTRPTIRPCKNLGMRFGPTALEDCEGTILGHNIVDPSGRRILRKGRALTADDVARLRDLGRREIYVAILEPGDIDENEAARRVTEAVLPNSGTRTSVARTGRVNVYATAKAVLEVDQKVVRELNSFTGVTLATLRSDAVVVGEQMIATTKILPYALPGETVRAAEEVAAKGTPVHLHALEPRRVGLLVAGSAGNRERLLPGFEAALKSRIEALGSSLAQVTYCALPAEGGAEVLAGELKRQTETELGLLLLAGETAIQDPLDLIPRSVRLAGGLVNSFGAPVDPGNLLMLAELGGLSILGTPGCARSPKTNVVDLVLPRILAGLTVTPEDVLDWGVGGLLEDVPERPLPRSRLA